MPRLATAATVLSLATLCASAAAFGQQQNANPAGPGTVNYVEGQVSLDGQALNQRSVGSAQIEPGQTVQTGNGKAEVLLTPGVFVRLDDHSALTMVSPSLTNTVVTLNKGKADVEVDELYKQNHIVINEANDQSILAKDGLYAFNADNDTLRVFGGKAAVFEGAAGGNQVPSADHEKAEVVNGGHQLALNNDLTKPTSFNKNAAQDELYNWSSLRSQYLGEANLNMATAYEGVGGFAPGWFWDPAFYGYTWLPGEGAFFNPFGFGFYSPFYLYGGGAVYRGGLGYRGAYAGGYARSGFVAHSSGFANGGFGGGFHGGGGFGGGRR